MYVIRFEKESLNDYMMYQIDNDSFINILMSNNRFYGSYENNEEINIQLYFKIIMYNKNIQFFIYDILLYINDIFKTNDDNWTVFIDNKMLNNNHAIYLYFYSNKYFTKLKYLKKIINNLYFKDIIFDDSIYYKTNSKYKDFIEVVLPNQIYKKNSYYKLMMGMYNNLVLDNIESLELLEFVKN